MQELANDWSKAISRYWLPVHAVIPSAEGYISIIADDPKGQSLAMLATQSGDKVNARAKSKIRKYIINGKYFSVCLEQRGKRIVVFESEDGDIQKADWFGVVNARQHEPTEYQLNTAAILHDMQMIGKAFPTENAYITSLGQPPSRALLAVL